MRLPQEDRHTHERTIIVNVNDRKVSFGVNLITFLGNGTVMFGCFLLIAGAIFVGALVYPQDMDIPFRQVDAGTLTATTDGVVVNVHDTPCGQYRLTYSFIPKGSSAKVTGIAYKTISDPSSLADMKVQVNYDSANPARSKMIIDEGKSATIAYMLWLLLPALGIYLVFRGIMAGKRRYALLTSGRIVPGKLARATRAYLLQSVLNSYIDGSGTDYVNEFNSYAFEFVTPDGRTHSVPTYRTDPAWKRYLGENNGELAISRLVEQIREIDYDVFRNTYSPVCLKQNTGTAGFSLASEPPCIDDDTLVRVAQELGIIVPDESTGPIHASGVSSTPGTAFEDYIIYDPANPDDAAILRDLFPAVRINDAGELVCSTGGWIRTLIWPALALCVTVLTIYLRVRQGESIWTKIISLMSGIS